MPVKKFEIEIDGCRVLINPETQSVSIKKPDGALLFHDHIQIAAGSVQGLFSMATDAKSAVDGMSINLGRI